jgi:hypothetical protein
MNESILHNQKSNKFLVVPRDSWKTRSNKINNDWRLAFVTFFHSLALQSAHKTKQKIHNVNIVSTTTTTTTTTQANKQTSKQANNRYTKMTVHIVEAQPFYQLLTRQRESTDSLQSTQTAAAYDLKKEIEVEAFDDDDDDADGILLKTVEEEVDEILESMNIELLAETAIHIPEGCIIGSFHSLELIKCWKQLDVIW